MNSAGQNFQVNLGGMIRLLSEHLYSDPGVYVRELLQNASDAITMRQATEPSWKGSICVELAPPDASPSVTVIDNGIGLTEAEVHQFLATIGESSKLETIRQGQFIGRFGIGLLSAFVVTDEITVITKSTNPNEPAVAWKGLSNGSYSIRHLEGEFDVGTRVSLTARPGCEDQFHSTRVEHLLRHYGHHLPHDAFFHDGQQRTQINDPAPWKLNTEPDRTEQLLEYGRRTFGEDYLEAIPFQDDESGIRGVALVLPHEATTTNKPLHQIYLREMFLTQSGKQLVPEWAFFFKFVINADDLQPNAARDAFFNNQALRNAQQAISNQLKRWLLRKAKYDTDFFENLVRLHYLPLKALAVEDTELYRILIDWLPFETSTGQVTLGEYFATNQRLRYVTNLDEFRYLSPLAAAQSMCIFNAGYVYDQQLLARLPDIYRGRDVEQTDVSEVVQRFDSITIEERSRLLELLRVAELVLQPFACRVDCKKFSPHDIAAIYYAGKAGNFLRSLEESQELADDLWGGILDNLADQAAAQTDAQLILNHQHPLIHRLADLREPRVLQRFIELLYVQSLLMGHHKLSAREREIIGRGMLDILNFINLNNS